MYIQIGFGVRKTCFRRRRAYVKWMAFVLVNLDDIFIFTQVAHTRQLPEQLTRVPWLHTSRTHTHSSSSSRYQQRCPSFVRTHRYHSILDVLAIPNHHPDDRFLGEFLWHCAADLLRSSSFAFWLLLLCSVAASGNQHEQQQQKTHTLN